MARPIKHDGGLFKRTESTVWWMQYRDKTGQRQRESTGTEDWNEAQQHPQRALGSQGQQHSSLAAQRARDHIRGMGGVVFGELFHASISRPEDARSEPTRDDAFERLYSRRRDSRT